ncbi:MAG TPA: glycosyltransferase family 4 protein [Acidimicrobiales bacterium]|nr:glycosyltransferase family 4 protein [Acidimicrobiales bacterium]
MRDRTDRRCHVALVYPACHRRGGVERVVWEAASRLAARQRVSVVSGVADDPPRGVHVVLVPGAPFIGPASQLRFRRSATRVVKALRPDVTVSFGSECPDADVLVMGSVHRTWVSVGGPGRVGPMRVPAGARYVLPRHVIRLALERTTVRRATEHHIVAVSENVAADLSRWYDVPADRVTVVPNGFDPEQCSPDRCLRLRNGMRKELGLGPEEHVLVLVANEYHRKGLSVLLSAMAEPILADGHLRLVLAGRMAPDEYRRDIVRLGLERSVRWIGLVDDVARCYAAADLFVLPTRYEAFGSVIIESLACGLPVITTAGAGAAVAVRPDINGLLMRDPEDPLELAGLLARAFTPGTLERWRPQCRPSVDGYEWSSVMERLETVIARAAAARSTQA